FAFLRGSMPDDHAALPGRALQRVRLAVANVEPTIPSEISHTRKLKRGFKKSRTAAVTRFFSFAVLQICVTNCA
ncbi:MAG: hypothetical protein FWB96_03895, partial [Defluviitaleaceae bacterium]|nr:hypothetical protein [Defluviitaleaceae bacterium]